MNKKNASIDIVDLTDFLSGGGEMGELIRSMDWSMTPLGPPSEWSQALRTTVGIILRAQFPFILWWGPQFIQFYNDAYRPIPGNKHPKSLGQPGCECWKEIWPVIGPMVEAPFSGKPASWSDDLLLIIIRKGFPEETHFKVSSGPVPDPTVKPSGIGGVLGTIAEITGQVLGERQLRTLRKLGARATEAKTSEQACRAAAEAFMENPRDVPFALFYLLDPEGRQVRLAADCGFEANGAANPEYMTTEGNNPWPISPVLEHGKIQIISNLSGRFSHLPTGVWSQPPHSAIALPLSVPDQPHVYGVLIAGISPHRELNESYRSFFELAADQVTTAIRNARAFQEERKRAEALAEIDRAKTTFFSNVSHEFRTPLTLMLGPIEDLLSRPESLSSSDHEQMIMAHRNTLRLLKLVNTLLDFSRIEAGRIEAVYEPTDLAAYTADLTSSFRSAIEKAGMELIVDCPPLTDPMYVDRD